MTKYLLRISLLFFAFAGNIIELSAQIKTQESKVVIIEKEISDNGKETIQKIVKNGEEAEAYLKMNSDETHDLEGKSKQVIEKKSYSIKVHDDKGQIKELEWDGSGEMPLEMKKIMDKQGIELDDVGAKTKKVKMVIKGKDDDEIQELEWDGKGKMPQEMKEIIDKEGLAIDDLMTGKTKMKIIRKGDSMEQVMNFDYQGNELPEDIRETLEKEGIEIQEIISADGARELKVITTSKEEKPNSEKKAQLGVNIEAHSRGIKVSDVIPESSADLVGIQKGDIIIAVDKQPVKEVIELVEAISNYKPNDKVVIEYERNGIAESKTVTLKERIDPFPFKNWEQVMKNKKGFETIEIEIEQKVLRDKK